MAERPRPKGLTGEPDIFVNFSRRAPACRRKVAAISNSPVSLRKNGLIQEAPQFGVQTLEESKPAIDVLSANGYQYWPYKVDVMHWFCKPDDSFRTHHLHLVPFESELWQQRICFRDKLRNSAALAKEYAELKQALAAKYRNDREAYTEKKWPFIQKVLNNN